MPVIAMNNSRASDLSSSSQHSTNVKIGGLWKRSQGVSRFTKPNYKHRVFILTDQALSYYAGTVDVSPWNISYSHHPYQLLFQAVCFVFAESGTVER